MKMRIVCALVGLVAVVSGCSKHAETCEKSVERSMECSDEKLSGDEKAQAKMLASGMCEAAFSEETGGADGETKKMMLEMYATMRKKATCMAQAKDCAAAKACSGSAFD